MLHDHFSFSLLLNEENIDIFLIGRQFRASCSPNFMTVMSHTKEQTRPDDFKWFVISSCHFRNVHTEYFEPRKSLQVEFPKSEKENFGEEIATLCLLGVQSTRTGHEIQRVTHTVFQIDNWAKSLS